MNKIDVLIAGAGPTGLTAATLLARYGVNFRIIDKNAAPAQMSKALGVQARTLELWDKLGLAERAVKEGQPLKSLHLITKDSLAQGGKPFMMLGRDGKEVSPYPYLLVHEQYKTEHMLLADLENYLGPKGAYAVERNTEISKLEPNADSVIVGLRHEDGSEETLEASWLIAADGAGSFVRKSLGLKFEGATYADPLFVADVDLEWPLERDSFYAQVPRQGMLTFFPMRGEGYSDKQYRIIARIPKELSDKETLTGEDIQTLLDQHSVVKAKITETRWVSKYHIHRRMTDKFRVGPIFLVGDAAHIHSPAGGQGMNTGIGDAWNLAWKLAHVVQGKVATKLLDSYELERIPVAKTILNGSDKGFSFIGSPNYFMHLLRSALLPRVTRFTSSNKWVGEKIFRLLSQTWIGYRKSPAVAGDRQNKRVQPGDRAPYAISVRVKVFFRYCLVWSTTC
jgi:2-polyprenyl-6-methoxyphenol hydroxylase-like FAD-dependent oxidoreductase